MKTNDMCRSMPKTQSEKLRKPPTPKVLKRLFTLSANQCANPTCDNVIVDSKGTVIGRVCHIAGAEKKGPRFDANLSEEEVRAFENLILLCANCHVIIDDDELLYTTGKIKKWKAAHERRFATIGERLQSAYLDTISEESDSIDVTLPKTFNAFSGYLAANGIDTEIDAGASAEVERFVANLKNLTVNDRMLVRAIVTKTFALASARQYPNGVAAHPEDLLTILVNNRRLTTYRINKLGEALARNGLGSLDPDGADTVLFVASPHDDLAWSDLKDFMESIGRTLDDLLIDLKFGLLD